MASAELHPPEFATFAAHVPDIIRPKPRRLSDVRNVMPSSPRPPGDGAPPALDFALDLNCADLENDVFRDDAEDCTPLRPLQRNLAGGSAPALHRSFSKPRPHTPHVAPPANTLVANREKFAGVDLNDCENVPTRAENSSSASNTDSLSSTEKGEVRRRPLPQRMKQRRRNILSFPQSLDLLLQQQKSRYDSSGHASMTESTASEYALSKDNVDSFDPEQLMEKLTITSGTTRSIRSAVSTDSDDQATHPAAKKVSPRVVHQSSMETVATNLTSSAADEFVWLDPAYRLVQLQRAPWDVIAVQRVIENSTKLKDVLHRIAQDAIPKLAFLLQRPLVRIAREAQRFARSIGVCGKSEITGALWVVLPPWLANNCVKACHRAAAIFGGASCSRQSKSSRAGLFFSVGGFHRWTMDAGLAPFIPEMAAVFLAAALENLLEEVVVSCLRFYETLTATTVDSALSQSGDLFGLFQSCTHLTMSRSSTGIPILPKWPVQVPQRGDEHSMLTTCVASVGELEELLQKALHLLNMAMRPAWGQNLVRWSSAGTRALYYYTRCSQLEHSQYGHQRTSSSLSPERSQLLPPIIEWVRVASAFTVYRHHSYMVDENDVLQAARLLLPGIDCPLRAFGIQQDPIEFLPDKINGADGVRLLNMRTAMRLLGTSTRLDIVHSVLKQVPNGVNTISEEGLTALMIAALRGDDASIKCLVSAGADVDIQTPGQTPQSPGARSECQFWTALTYAVAQGNVGAAKALLEAGAQVEAGGETYPTDTPLQLAVAAAHNDMITLLLSFGAHPYLSTMTPDNQCYAQGLSSLGTPSPVAVAAAHGHRSVLHRLVSHPIQGSSPQTAVSLEEILSEGSQSTLQRKTRQYKFSKNQWRCLQEAMYHSAENGFLEITLDLRNMGVSWTLHSWSKSLMTCHLQQHEAALSEILQDFQMAWTTQESSTLLTEETFPLMFELMACSKNESVTLAIVDILSQCFGRESLESIPLPVNRLPGPRIDPRYVNSPEMADVRFVVEGKSFFGHRIILVNASERFKEMLAAGGTDQVVTIKDIRYPIFQMVMEYLYKGGFDGIAVSPQDALELLTASNYFQLAPLVTYCEHICTKTVTVENVVSVFIHARVYHASQLLRYCLGFMLQNLVTLMSYDSAFRKLLVNPEDHGDLLNRLKYALQIRVRQRDGQPMLTPGRSPIV